jgi:hypothetical protein
VTYRLYISKKKFNEIVIVVVKDDQFLLLKTNINSIIKQLFNFNKKNNEKFFSSLLFEISFI